MLTRVPKVTPSKNPRSANDVNLGEDRSTVSKIRWRTDKHAHRQTDTLIAILRFTIGGGVVMLSSVPVYGYS